MRRRAVALLVAVTVFGWTGCGDADHETPRGREAAPGAGEATTAPEAGREDDAFAAAANRVCERAVDQMSEVAAPRSDVEWSRFGGSIERRFTHMVDELAALDPSHPLEGKFDEWLRKLDASRRAFRELYETGPRNDWRGAIVERAYGRANTTDVVAREWAQVHLTDLYSCYNVTPWYVARRAGA